MLADALTKALCEVKFTKFAKSILIQGTRLDQSGRVEEQASAARLILKQAHASRTQAQGSGSILATEN
jgi:hypothetical protein